VTKQAMTADSAPDSMLRSVVETSRVPMAIRSLDLRPIFVNKAFRDFYCKSRNARCSQTPEDLLPPQTRTLFHEAIRPAILRGDSWEGEYLVRTGRTAKRHVWARFDPLRDSVGRISFAWSSMFDASDHVRTSERLHTSKRFLTLQAENESDLIFRVSLPDGHIEHLGESCEKLTGHSASEFATTPSLIRDIVPESDLPALERDWRDILRGIRRAVYLLPLRHKDGSMRWVEIRIGFVRDEAGTAVAAEGVATDVTDRRRTQMAVEQSTESLRFLADNMADTLWCADDDGRIIYASPASERILGLHSSKLAGKPLQSIFDEEYDELLSSWLDKCRDSGTDPHTVELPYDHPHLGRRWISLHGTGAVRRNDETMLLGLARDVTRRRRVLNHLYESESRYRSLFEESPISLWEEDCSEVKNLLDELGANGVEDIASYLRARPEKLREVLGTVRVLDVNRATLELMEAADKKALLGNVNELLPDEALAPLADVAGHIANGETNLSREVALRTLSGEKRWTLMQLCIPREFSKNMERVLISFHDLTPHHEAERALQESERRYRTLVDNSSEGVVVSQDDTFLFANNAFRRIWGLEELPDSTSRILKSVHPEDREGLMDWVGSREAPDSYSEVVRLMAGEREMRWVTLARKELIWQGRPALMYILSDVTAHKILERELLLAHGEMEDRVTARTAELHSVNQRLKAEMTERAETQELLDESRLSFKALLDASPDFTCLLGEDFTVLASNAISTHLFGLTPDELKDRRLTDILPREAGTRLARTAKTVMRSGEAALYEDTHDGRTFENSLYPVRNDSGELRRMAFYSRDITERHHAREQIRSLTKRLFTAQESERRRISRELHDKVAQDLSSALMAIETLESADPQGAPRIGGMQASEVLRNSVASVREIAYGLHPSGLRQLGLQSAVQRLCDDFAARHDIRLECSFSGLERMEFELEASTAIYRIIQESLDNIARHAEAESAVVRIVAAHPDIIIRIEDQGVGFDCPDSSAEGLADCCIGLRSIQERSRLLGGETTIHSRPGAGTRVVVKLPGSACKR